MKSIPPNPPSGESEPVINLAGDTYVVPGPTNIGLYARDGQAWLVDSGNDKEAGRRLNKIATDRGWRVVGVVNTHSNADHAGGNAFLQAKTGCRIAASVPEAAFVEAPEIEAAFLWGGFAPRELRNKFFEAKPSRVTDRIAFPPHAGEGPFSFSPLPAGLSAFPLPGHFFGMVGVLTADRVAFLGDSLFGETVLSKYRVPFIYDAASFAETLKRLPGLDADAFVPSHGPVLRGRGELAALTAKNLERFEELCSRVLSSVDLRGAASFEDALADTASAFGIALDAGQYALVGSTVRSVLSYLRETGSLDAEFADNRLSWRRAR